MTRATIELLVNLKSSTKRSYLSDETESRVQLKVDFQFDGGESLIVDHGFDTLTIGRPRFFYGSKLEHVNKLCTKYIMV